MRQCGHKSRAKQNYKIKIELEIKELYLAAKISKLFISSCLSLCDGSICQVKYL